MKPWCVLFFAVFLSQVSISGAAETCASHEDTTHWPAWDHFKTHFITPDGRVKDPSSDQRITTSEGQSYGMFYALVVNDQDTFGRLLNWTQTHLAQGDLGRHLPAWKWGLDAKGRWRVLDSNSASDSDLWIAYNLLEAGRLWNVRRYTVLGTLLAQRILREETAKIEGLGRVLIPGKIGFDLEGGGWKLNPSYSPIQLLRRLAEVPVAPGWKQTAKPTVKLILASAPKGIAPDWVNYSSRRGAYFGEHGNAVGSYGAIRVYLWAGMMSNEDPLKQALLDGLRPMAGMIRDAGFPPEKINVVSLETQGQGSMGFSAAMLPFLDAIDSTTLLTQQKQRIKNNPISSRTDNYYEQVLSLFGRGWIERRYRFGKKGYLMLPWNDTCDDPK